MSEIETQIRAENPFTVIDGETFTAGDSVYEDLIAQWVQNAIDEAETPLPISVSNLAFTESLIEHEIFPDMVEAALDQIADQKLRWTAKVRWQQSRIALTDPLLQSQAAAFGLSSEQLEAIYRRAVEIEQG